MEPLTANDPQRVGSFGLIGRLGTSSSGTVYLAESTAGRRVVVKLLPASYASQAQARERFAREVDISRRLVGLFTPEVVGADVDGPVPWMATRYIEGRSLYAEVSDTGSLPAPRVLDLATGVAEALAAVHAAGLVHRDLKPSHVVLSRDGAHLIGFATAAAPGEVSLTPDGLILGTVEYIAPELVVGGPATPAADVFSLGGLLYFAATGEPPFGSGHPAALIHRITSEAPDLGRITDPGLRDLVGDCLDRDPDRRPTAEQIVTRTAEVATDAAAANPGAHALTVPGVRPPAPLIGDSLSDATTAEAFPGPAVHDTGDTYRPPPSALSRAFNRRTLLIGGGTAVALGGVSGAGYLLLRPDPPLPSPAPDHVITAHRTRATGIGVVPDGSKALTTTTSGQLVLWDIAAAKVVSTLTDGSTPFTTLTTTTDGKTAYVGGLDGVIRVVDVAAWKIVRRVTVHNTRIGQIAVAPNGRFVISASPQADGAVARIWDPGTGAQLLALDAGSYYSGAEAVAVSPDSSTVATVALGGKINLWDPSTGQRLRGLVDDTSRTSSVAFSPNGKTFATTSSDRQVRLWDTATCKQVATIESGSNGACTAMYLPSGKVLLSTGYQAIGTVTPELKMPIDVLAGPASRITQTVITPNARLVLASSYDGDSRVWTLEDGRNTTILQACPGGARSLAFSASGASLVSGGDDGVMRVWDPDTGEQKFDHRFAYDDNLSAVAVSTVEATRIAVSRNGGITASNISPLALIDPLVDRIKPQLLFLDGGDTLAFSPDGAVLATGGDNDGPMLVDVASGKKIRSFVGQQGKVTSVAYAPDGATVAVASLDPSVRLWNPADGTVRRDLVGHTDHVLSVTFSPDGRTVVTGGKDATVRVWDTGSGRMLRTLRGHTGAVLAVAASPDGRMIASAGLDGVVRVWRASDGTAVARLAGHQGAVLDLAFHPKKPRALASSGQDGKIRLWTLPATKEA